MVILALVLILQLFLWTTFGQTLLGNLATSYLSDYLEAEISIGKIDITFFNHVTLKEVYVEDQKGDTLAYIEGLEVAIGKLQFKSDRTVLHFNRVELLTPRFYLNVSEGDTVNNMNFLLNAFASNDTTSKDLYIESGLTVIDNGRFYWHDYNFPHVDSGVDWKHLQIDSIYLNAEDFYLLNDSMSALLARVGLREYSGFALDTLAGFTIFSPRLTNVENLLIKTPNSRILGSLKYKYTQVGDYGNFIDDIFQKYRVDSSIVAMSDIAYFAPTLTGMEDVYSLAATVTGPVSRMNIKNIHLTYKDNTHLDGSIMLNGLPDFESTFITANLKRVSTTYSDLNNYLLPPVSNGNKIELPEKMSVLGLMSFQGHFTGFINDFVTYGQFNSNAGLVKTDLKLSPKENTGVLTYSGNIATKNFNLELVTENELFGNVDMKMKVEGEDFDFDKMKLTAKGEISKFDFKGYSYQNISVDGGIEYSEIEGLLTIDDPNLNLEFDGMINLQDIPRYAFRADINAMYPTRLNLMDKDSNAFLSTEMIFNFKGNSINNVLGRAGLRNFTFREEEDVYLKRVDLLAMTQSGYKTLSLESENIQAQLTGKFNSREAIASINSMVYKWLPNLYDEKPTPSDSSNQFDFYLNAWNFSGFSSIFLPGITFKDSINITASYNSDSSLIKASVNGTEVSLTSVRLHNFEGDVFLSDDSLTFDVEADRIFLSDERTIENYTLDTRADSNVVDLKTTWKSYPDQPVYSGQIMAEIAFNSPTDFHISFDSSFVTENDTTWTIADSSQIKIRGKEITVTHFDIDNQGQGFTVDGRISENPNDTMTVEMRHFDLAHLNNILKIDNTTIRGVGNGSATLRDVYNSLIFTSDLDFKNLAINNETLGSGKFYSTWNNDKNDLDVDVLFTDHDLERLKLEGTYSPSLDSNQLDLVLHTDSMPIAFAEPWINDFVTDLKGSISGNLNINGSIKAPKIEGRFRFNEVQTNVVYLNQVFRINDEELFLMDDLIGCDAIRILDDEGKASLLNLSIFHDNFRNFNIDMSMLTLDNMRVINTTERDNDLFYGTVYLQKNSIIGMDTEGDGTLNLNIVSKLGEGTKFFIPLYESSSSTDQDYITFTTLTQQSDSVRLEAYFQPEESDINLNLELELSPKAEIQLLLDRYSDDKITASGEGNIAIAMNKEHGFTINGTYQISKGSYLFTFSNIISKYFKILPESKIMWNGDPMAGMADIVASYGLRTSLYDLGIAAAYDSSEMRKRIPVEVLLYMTENYTNPLLKFGFKLPAKYNEIETLLNGLDDGEKNNQVFSLLILNKFLPITGGGANITAGGAFGASTAEMLSNQLSNWLSNISEDVDIGVRYKPGDQISADEVEVALSTQLFNDRLLLETNVGVTTGANTATQSQNIVGEFTLTYKINKNGNLTGKVFNRSNDLNPVYANQAPYTQGVGIGYTEQYFNKADFGCRVGNNFKKGDKKRDCDKENRAYELSRSGRREKLIQRKLLKYKESDKRREAKKARRAARKKPDNNEP